MRYYIVFLFLPVLVRCHRDAPKTTTAPAVQAPIPSPSGMENTAVSGSLQSLKETQHEINTQLQTAETQLQEVAKHAKSDQKARLLQLQETLKAYQNKMGILSTLITDLEHAAQETAGEAMQARIDSEKSSLEAYKKAIAEISEQIKQLQ